MDIIKTIIGHISDTRAGVRPAQVSSGTLGGHPLGAPPAIGAGDALGNDWRGGGGWMDAGVTPAVDAPNAAQRAVLPPHRPVAQMYRDVFEGDFDITRTNDIVWWDSPRPAQDIIGNRHTRAAVDSYASLREWGSSDVASGPEGTLVLMPPRMPRALATPRAIQGARAANVLLNYANSQVQTPDVKVAP